MGPRWWNSPTSQDAYRLCIVSIVITSIAAVGGIAGYFFTDSSLILSYGLENAVDFMSSVAVLWRFYKPDDRDPSREALLAKRELKASTAVSFVLFILGIGIVVAAAHDFKLGKEQPEGVAALIVLSLASMIVFGGMTMVKLQYSTILASPSLYKDGFCSLIGTLMSISLFYNTLIIVSDANLWWLDPFVACVVGVLSIFVGLTSLCKMWWLEGIPVWSLGWWMYGEGADGDVVVENAGVNGGGVAAGADLEMTTGEKDDAEGGTGGVYS